MKVLIKSATIMDPQSSHHLSRQDVLLENGVIKGIKTKINVEVQKTIDKEGLHLSPGWIDMRANFQDPGFEYKEDLFSGMNAAARGGFTGVVLMPSTEPRISHKSQVEYLLNKAKGNIVRIFPTGTMSVDKRGENLSEMFDMHSSGAIAFTDDKTSVNKTEMMSRGLDYVRNFNGLVMAFPFDSGVNPGGVVHESEVSVSLGMKGIPSLSEELRLERDIELLRYHGGRLHVSLISTARSVEIIRKAKKEGLQITAGVCAHQLYFTAKDLESFDTRLKVLPPFRSNKDRKALTKGLKDGTIDIICSDHSPEDVESKKKEFEYAAYGISAIESTFSTANTVLSEKMNLEEWISCLTSNPRKILGLEPLHIEEGQPVDLTLFNPTQKFTFEVEKMASRSKNTPFGGHELTGTIIGIAREEGIQLNS